MRTLERRIFLANLCFRREIAKVAFIYREECGFLFVKAKVNFAYWAVAMLFYENFRNARPVGIFIHFVVAMNEHHNIGILFQTSAIAKVRQARTPSSLFNFSRKL